MSRTTVVACVFAGAFTIGALAAVPVHSGSHPAEFAPATVEPVSRLPDAASAAEFRDQSLRTAHFWHPADPAHADLATNPPDPSGLLSNSEVACRYIAQVEGGTTPKFRCRLIDGEVVKVKYGNTAEGPAELAATRLASSLGFGADRVYLVPRVRCYGCPRFPFHAMRGAALLGVDTLFATLLSDHRYTDFESSTVERDPPGTELTGANGEGWAWFELAGEGFVADSRRVELDALRLLARFLAHWDNKAENQRLICREPIEPAAGRCADAFAFIHDLGATFGPRKADLDAWEQTPVWADRAACRVSMRDFPYEGGTFVDVEITEAGRQLLLRQLRALDERQVTSLFAGARFPAFHRRGRAADPQAWADAFNDKVLQIEEGGRCPQ